jgi:acyl-CoA synthetase (AMP-forming)/AMP-acid ligase II
MGIIEHVLGNAARFPGKPALILGDTVLGYAELVEQTRRTAAGLAALGVRPGTKLAVVLPNSVEFIAIMMAAADLGATIVPMNGTLSLPSLSAAIRATDASLLIAWHGILKSLLNGGSNAFPLAVDHCVSVGGSLAGAVNYGAWQENDNAHHRLGGGGFDEEQDYILTMTSGSTGAPKPIVLTQGTKIRRCFSARDLYRLNETDVILTATPLYHSLAERLVLLPLITGGTAVVIAKFTPANWLACIERRKVTFTIAVSSQLEMVLEEMDGGSADLSSLRTVVSSSAPLKTDAKRRLIRGMSCDVHECYGTSEIAIATNLSPENSPSKLETVGKAIPGVEIRVLDDADRPLPPGALGEIACRTPLAFAGYYNNPKATAACRVDGYLRTGDLGFLDDEGFLHFAGRKKEIIITGGINVFPKDVEDVINAHPKVRECAVIGVDDRRLGESVLAVVSAQEGNAPTTRELQRHCARHLADFQQPLGYEFVSDLPRNAIGKVIKHRLFEQYRERDATAALHAILKGTEHREPVASGETGP